MFVTQTCTGNVWMGIIGGEAREFIEPVIRQRVRASSEMWSDGHPTYEWLEDVGFDHKTCIHSNREFSKIDEETGELMVLSRCLCRCAVRIACADYVISCLAGTMIGL